MYAPYTYIYKYLYIYMCVSRTETAVSWNRRCLPHSPMRKMQTEKGKRKNKLAAKCREFISYKYYIIISREYIRKMRGRQQELRFINYIGRQMFGHGNCEWFCVLMWTLHTLKICLKMEMETCGRPYQRDSTAQTYYTYILYIEWQNKCENMHK